MLRLTLELISYLFILAIVSLYPTINKLIINNHNNNISAPFIRWNKPVMQMLNDKFPNNSILFLRNRLKLIVWSRIYGAPCIENKTIVVDVSLKPNPCFKQ